MNWREQIFRAVFWICLVLGLGWWGWRSGQTPRPKIYFPPRGEFIKLDHANVYFNDKGQGRPLLLLHGFPYHSEAYSDVAALSWKGYRLLEVDFPGAGLSESGTSERLTPEDLALQLKLFLDKLGISEVDVVGHDLGGGVAMILAARHPRLVKRLVLIAPDSSVGSSPIGREWWWRIPVVSPLAARMALGRDFIRQTLKNSWAVDEEGWLNFVERYAQPLLTTEGRAGFWALDRGRRGFDYLSYEERIQARTLILWGSRDPLLAPALAGQLARILPQARVVLLPGVGHLPLEEAPKAVVQALQDFLGPPPPILAQPASDEE